MRRRVAVILSGFPRRSETFVLNELLALDAAGMLGPVFATKAGDETSPQPGADRLCGRVEHLPSGSAHQQAAVVAERLDGCRIAGVHGYFAHRPAHVAALAAAHREVPYGFSMHARDARKVPRDVLAARGRRAACVIVCNRDVAGEVANAACALRLVPHGVNCERFRPRPIPPGQVLRLVAVGRLVEKKGFDVLIEAARALRVPFHLRIIGAGPERPRLEAAIARRGLGRQVSLCGPRTHVELPGEYAAAHVVVVPSRVDRSGDRDGLPNVVLEAMASGRVVVASDVAAIGTAVRPDRNGVLVPPDDPASLALTLDRLARHPECVTRMGARARKTAERHFELNACTQRFTSALQEAYA